MIGDLKNKFIHPLKEILHDSRSIGIILLLCTAISLIIANLPSISAGYQNFWEHSFDGTTNHLFACWNLGFAQFIYFSYQRFFNGVFLLPCWHGNKKRIGSWRIVII
jgi:hypothetical protein